MLSSAQDKGPDELWEMTTKMEMAGVPMQMPAQTQRVCKPKAAKDEELVPRDNNCKLLDSKRSGNKFTFKVACDDGKNKYTGTGEVERSGDTTKGMMHMQGSVDGQPMDMTHQFTSRKVGSCTYEDPAKKYNEAIAQQCSKALEDLNWGMFAMDSSPCKDKKPEFCKRATAMGSAMREPVGYRTQLEKKEQDWQNILKTCNQDPQALTAEVCKKSVAGKDWKFVGDYCPAEGKAIAAQQCAGRSYTAMMSSEYAPLCSRFASDMGRSYTAQPADATKAQPQRSAQPQGTQPQQGGQTQGTQPPAQPQKPGATEQVKEGVNKLKKFLKF
jgi:hypothetical protein